MHTAKYLTLLDQLSFRRYEKISTLVIWDFVNVDFFKTDIHKCLSGKENKLASLQEAQTRAATLIQPLRQKYIH